MSEYHPHSEWLTQFQQCLAAYLMPDMDLDKMLKRWVSHYTVYEYRGMDPREAAMKIVKRQFVQNRAQQAWRLTDEFKLVR